jgi:hypothetical protein
METMSDDAKFSIKMGLEYPYNERDPVHNYELAALGILANLNDRRGIKQGFYGVDLDIREEIVTSLADIIREAIKFNTP